MSTFQPRTLLGLDDLIAMYRAAQSMSSAVGGAQIHAERDTVDALPLGHE